MAGLYICLSGAYGFSFPNGYLVRDPFLLSGSVLGAIGVMYAAIRSANEKWNIHFSWMLFAVAYLLDNLSTILQVFFRNFSLGVFPWALIMVSYSLITVGIVMLPSSPRSETLRSRQFMELMVFTLVSTVATWIFLVIPFVFYGYNLFDQIFTILTFLMVFAVFDLLLRRRQNHNQKTGYLLCISIAATVIGELLIAIQRSEAPLWMSIVMNLCWMISYASVGLAGLSCEFLYEPVRLKEKTASFHHFENGWDFLLPAGWAGLVFALLIWSHYHPEVLSFSVMAAGTGSLFAILVIRLGEAVKENARLIKDAQQEIDSRKRMQEKFWHDSRHDPLTNLPNRSYLVDQLQNVIETTREAQHINSSLLFLDLDRFKTINDRYGHDIGDQLLKAVSERLIFCVRPDDFVARLGGDEFAILLNNLQSSQTVYKIAARIMEKMREPFEIQGTMVVSGVSFGISFIQPGCSAPDEILKEADGAMYKAKRKGRGRFEISKALEF
jgi:diguanylate cyclase (GGDEF)-like protein